MQCLNAFYGTILAALLYDKMFKKSLTNTKQGYKINPYDGCMANKVVKGKQVTICSHIHDCKNSHKFSAVIDDTIAWLRVEYKIIFEDGFGHMKVHRGKTHTYLGMSLNFSHKAEVLFLMSRRMLHTPSETCCSLLGYDGCVLEGAGEPQVEGVIGHAGQQDEALGNNGMVSPCAAKITAHSFLLSPHLLDDHRYEGFCTQYEKKETIQDVGNGLFCLWAC